MSVLNIGFPLLKKEFKQIENTKCKITKCIPRIYLL